VDRVIEAGHDPKRFADDLLERLRDLVIIDAVPDTAASILSEHPADELERMRQQAGHFGAAALSRAADIVNAGLTEMRGATAPRLQLELMCARVLLPAADDGDRGYGARLDRLERRVAIADSAPAPAAARAATRDKPAPPAAAEAPAAPTDAPPVLSPPAATEAVEPPAEKLPPAAAAPEATGVDLVTVRRLWPDVLSAVAAMKRTTWSFISQNAAVRDVSNDRLTLSFSTAGLRDVFLSRSDHQDFVREALIQVLGVDWKVDAIVDPSGAPGPAQPPSEAAGRTAPAASPAAAAPVEDTPSADDPDADDGDVTHQDLLARELGAKVIGEYDAS
jgi:DNA polymerase-3 subunit gamma/tau